MLLVLLVSIAVAAPALAAPAVAAPAPPPTVPIVVVPPAGHPYGKTYGEWSAAWWQWAFSVPLNHNPLKDLTGDDCAQGQSGSVFFIGATYGHFATVNRTCKVSGTKAIFFPIINCESENTIRPGDAPTSYTFEQLSGACRDGVNQSTDLSAQLDGRNVTGLTLGSLYHAASPSFAVTPVENNLLQDNGYIAPGGQTIDPVGADGVYLMIGPLLSGTHKVHFHATGGPLMGGGTLDVTYTLVTPTA